MLHAFGGVGLSPYERQTYEQGAPRLDKSVLGICTKNSMSTAQAQVDQKRDNGYNHDFNHGAMSPRKLRVVMDKVHVRGVWILGFPLFFSFFFFFFPF